MSNNFFSVFVINYVDIDQFCIKMQKKKNSFGFFRFSTRKIVINKFFGKSLVLVKKF